MIKYNEKIVSFDRTCGKAHLNGLPSNSTLFRWTLDFYENVEIIIEKGMLRLEGDLLRIGKELHFVSIFDDCHTSVEDAIKKGVIFSNDDVVYRRTFFGLGKTVGYLKVGLYKIGNCKDKKERIIKIFTNFEYNPSNEAVVYNICEKI